MTSNNTIPPVQDEELGNIGERGNDLALTHQSDATGINAAATVGPSTPATSNAAAAAATSAGTNHDARMMLEQFDDDVEPYRPTVGASDDEDQILKGEVHVEEIKDNANPDHELSHLTDGMANETKKIMAAAAPTKLEQIDDDGFPVHPTEFEDDIDAKMKAKAKTNNYEQAAVKSDDEESILVPTREEIEGEPEVVTRGVNVIRNRGNAVPHLRPLVDVGGTEDVENRDPNMERESSVPVIPKAFLVQESDVVVATPTVPWWKQRRTRFLLCSVFVVVTILSVALGVSFSLRDQNVTEVVTMMATSSPSVSFIPTLHPTTGRPSLIPSSSPSSSQVPSSSPTTCSYTISTSMQKLDLLNPNPDTPKVAIDGGNMVIVSREFEVSMGFGETRGNLYIVFFSQQDDGQWERSGYFIENNIILTTLSFSHYDLAISGNTAVLGLPTDEVVYVFQQNSIGLWAKVDELIPQPVYCIAYCIAYGFGWSVDIDGDLLVVADYWRGYTSFASNSVHVFKRNTGLWELIHVLTHDLATISDCSVRGDIIALSDEGVLDYLREDLDWTPFIELYILDRNDDSLSKFQVVNLPNERIKSIDALSNKHLVYRTDSRISIFHREAANQEFVYVQQFNASDHGDQFGRQISMDKGLLVIGEADRTLFFAENDGGGFEENLILEYSYDSFQLSERTFIGASKDEVNVMSIADCTPSTPTQVPSVSIAPTSCHDVEVTFSSTGIEWSGSFYYDLYHWEAIIQRIDPTSGDSVEVTVYTQDNAIFKDEQYKDDVCLMPGNYQFVFRGVGIYYDGQLLDIHYSVNSNGQLIAQEGQTSSSEMTNFLHEVDISHITDFGIPFNRSTSSSPTGSPYVGNPITPYPISPQPITPFPTPIEPQTPTANPTSIVSTQLPSNSESKPPAKVCLDQSECANQLEKTGLESFNVGEYPDYGCFMKGDKLYWGAGGTNEQIAIDPLSGAKERVWC